MYLSSSSSRVYIRLDSLRAQGHSDCRSSRSNSVLPFPSLSLPFLLSVYPSLIIGVFLCLFRSLSFCLSGFFFESNSVGFLVGRDSPGSRGEEKNLRASGLV